LQIPDAPVQTPIERADPAAEPRGESRQLDIRRVSGRELLADRRGAPVDLGDVDALERLERRTYELDVLLRHTPRSISPVWVRRRATAGYAADRDTAPPRRAVCLGRG